MRNGLNFWESQLEYPYDANGAAVEKVMKDTSKGAKPKTESDLEALPLLWTSNFASLSLSFFMSQMES